MAATRYIWSKRMTWRERQQWGDRFYRRASFKGIPFWVDDYSLDAGRRQAIQKFPGNQYTNVQDLGRDSAGIRVSAYLLGDDYDLDRKSLESALLEGGKGELYLPFRGPLTVTIVGRVRVDESGRERGICRIIFECIESKPAPSHSRTIAIEVNNNAASARQASRFSFADKFEDMKLLPESRKYTARAALNEFSDVVVDIQGRVSAFIAEIPSAANVAIRLSGALNELINTPLDLNDAIVNAIESSYISMRSIGDTGANVISTWGAGGPVRILKDQTFTTVDEFTPPTISTSTNSGTIEQQGVDALYRMIRLNLLYTFASLITDLPFESRQQAIALRTEYIATIDPIVEELFGTEYEAVYNLNPSVGLFLEEVAATLPNIASFTPSDALPSLVLAQMIYGDATRENEIVLRNSITHPGFVPEGEPLEILSV